MPECLPTTERPPLIAGVLLTGGEDVNPALYGEVNRCSRRVNPERDNFELELLRDAFSRELPILAVCRGVQLLAVAFGAASIKISRKYLTHAAARGYAIADRTTLTLRIRSAWSQTHCSLDALINQG